MVAESNHVANKRVEDLRDKQHAEKMRVLRSLEVPLGNYYYYYYYQY